MCNFYMMYWVDGDKLLEDNVCTSPGPPNYYFGYDQVYSLISLRAFSSIFIYLEFKLGKNSSRSIQYSTPTKWSSTW